MQYIQVFTSSYVQNIEDDAESYCVEAGSLFTLAPERTQMINEH